MCEEDVKAYYSDEFIFEPVITFREPTDTVMDVLRDLLLDLDVSPWYFRFSFITKIKYKIVTYPGDLVDTLDYLRQMLREDYADSEREIDLSWGRFEYGIGHRKDNHLVVSIWNRLFSPQEGGSIVYSMDIRRIGSNKYWIWGAWDEDKEDDSEIAAD